MTLAVETWLQIAVLGIAVLVSSHGFLTGWLPTVLKRAVGVADIETTMESIKADTEQLKADHEDTIEEINTLKNGQVAIAEVVTDDDKDLDAEHLRMAHFSDTDNPNDFFSD